MELINQININQMLVTALTLTVAGIIGFWCKDVPIKIWNFIKRQCTTTLDITSVHNSFYNLMKFLEEKYHDRNFRNFKLINGRWGDNEIATMGIGYGGHFVKFENLILYISLTRQDSQGTSIDKETITITKFGRNRRGFDKFFKAIATDKQKETNIQIYRMKDHWFPMNQIPKRAMDTIFIEESKKEVLLKTIDNFIKEEQWYLDNGIPYHLGILLYGNPGTGKSSLIKAIASYMNYNIYYLSVSHLYKIEECMGSLPQKSIIVIEDIDCEKVVHNRNPQKEITASPMVISEANSSGDDYSFINFSDVLNAIDGICSAHGRILITTTNHVEKLDPALIRPGRIDLKLEVGNVNQEILNQFLKRFFREAVDVDFDVKNNLTCAELQDLLLQKKSYDVVVEYSKAKY